MLHNTSDSTFEEQNLTTEIPDSSPTLHRNIMYKEGMAPHKINIDIEDNIDYNSNKPAIEDSPQTEECDNIYIITVSRESLPECQETIDKSTTTHTGPGLGVFSNKNTHSCLPFPSSQTVELTTVSHPEILIGPSSLSAYEVFLL